MELQCSYFFIKDISNRKHSRLKQLRNQQGLKSFDIVTCGLASNSRERIYTVLSILKYNVIPYPTTVRWVSFCLYFLFMKMVISDLNDKIFNFMCCQKHFFLLQKFKITRDDLLHMHMIWIRSNVWKHLTKD